MAEALDPTLGKKEFHNWLKGALSVIFAKEGLSEFVQTEVTDFHTDLINSVITQNGISPGTTCVSCTTANVLSCPTANFCSKGRRCNKHDRTLPGKTPNIQCMNNLCNGLKDGIRNQHNYNQPSWQNSDATKWCADAFEAAKCFMPPDGYSGKRSLAETDFNGMISIIINNKRFHNKMTTQLNTPQNTCSKARDIVNATIRHSGSNELSDLQLAQCIDALRDVLKDSMFLVHDQHAQAAVNKLNQLQNNTLTINAGDITRALEENIRDCLSQQQQEAVQAIQKYLDTAQTASVAALENIKSAALDEIRKTADDKKQEILQLAQQQQTQKDDVLFKDLKEDIITYYREHESVIPASPLVDEHNVPIEELYVLPPMRAYKNSYFKPSKKIQKRDDTSGKDYQDRQEITISQLFLSGEVRYKKIYITANAGFGKTSLSQALTMIWCQSHAPLTSLKKKYKGEESAAMKYFDLLFLLHLRDYQSEPKCNLDDLIMQMVLEKLSRSTNFTKEFIQNILHQKKCLIILDGLDEWAHPGRCTRKPEVPHNNHPDSCTVLTTTRDWKMGTIGLSPKDIDRRVEISMLDNETRNLLEQNALGILNERKLNLTGKNVADFDEEVQKVQIGNIVYIPYILLQLMCLFFGGILIGKSKCELYSNITEFTLERGLNKKDLPNIHAQLNNNASVPNFMKEKETCKRYFTLLMRLGKLAFHTLFSEKRELSLIFDRRIVTQYMIEQEFEFFLKVGLLCQTKDCSIIAVKQYHVFFQHKSVQEFFSAIYITSEWQNESVKSTIVQFCSSLSSTLEMENLFVFVCGMNPEVYSCISGELQKIIDLDGVTRQFACRTDKYSGYYDERKTLDSYQSMQMQCLHESMRNGNESYPIYLYVMLGRQEYSKGDLTAFKTMIYFNKGHVKSLLLSYSYEKAAFIKSLGPAVFTSLETLRADCHEEPVWLADILTKSARTLKCLSLGRSSLSDISITALKGMTCLQSFCLRNVEMTHSNHQCLFACINESTRLTQLKLQFIKCSECMYQHQTCDATLNLRRLSELKMLYLYGVHCRELYVNPACLEKLEFHPKVKMTARASATLWQDLRAAPVLSSLILYNMISSCQEMAQTIPTLKQLQNLKLERIDMDDVILLSPAMKKLELVELSSAKMTFAAWKELVLIIGVLHHPVTVKLKWCRGPSDEEWKTIVNVINATPTLSLLSDLSIHSNGDAFLTLKNNPVF